MPGRAARVRAARPDEAAAITELALRSKRSWGYSDDFMELVRADLVVTAGDIERDRTDVVEVAGRLVGYCRLLDLPGHAELEDLFIDPDATGQGHARRLFGHVVELARRWGHRVMEWDSDPNAESFYLRQGAVTVGETPSALLPGRRLPRMRYVLDTASEPPASDGGVASGTSGPAGPPVGRAPAG